jgi:8-oxo-dGTP pyrophosphatase MutT (NUDIX family)
MTLAERLRAALETQHDPILLTGDFHDFDPDEITRPAAVLIPVTDRADPGVILTVRNANMRRHAGQIAFPGGRIDPEDDGPVDAALREAEEEIALPRSAVQVIGTGDRYRTVTGYCVTPVIGVVTPDLVLRPAEAEVAEVFEVPLSFLLNRDNHVEGSADYQGQMRRFYEIPWEGRHIWGATAAMIVNLSKRLQWTA